MRGNIHMIQGYRHCVKKATAHAFSEIRDCVGLLKVILAKRFIVCERFSKFKPSGSVSILLNIPKLWRAIAYGVSKKFHVDLCRFRLRGHITLQRVDKGHVVKTRSLAIKRRWFILKSLHVCKMKLFRQVVGLCPRECRSTDYYIEATMDSLIYEHRLSETHPIHSSTQVAAVQILKL